MANRTQPDGDRLTEGSGQPCPLTQTLCDFALQLSTAFAQGDGVGVLALWQPQTMTCTAEFIREAALLPDLPCQGAQPGDQGQGYAVSGGDTDCGPACVGALLTRDGFVASVQQMATEAEPDLVDEYGPGNLWLLGFLSPLYDDWGQDGPHQLAVLLTDIAP